MTGKIKSISNPRLHLDILSPQDVERIHTATLDVIEKTGVRFPSKKALDIWEAHGAKVEVCFCWWCGWGAWLYG